MAEVGSRWYNPFDPQDPDALASAALGSNPQEYATQVAERPQARIARRRAASLADPGTTANQIVPGEFGALDVADRSAAGYPGAFLPPGATFDPHELQAQGVPLESGGFYARDTRAPTVEDYLNPISQQAGYLHIYDAARRDREMAERAAANRRAMLEESQKQYQWTQQDKDEFERLKKKLGTGPGGEVRK